MAGAWIWSRATLTGACLSLGCPVALGSTSASRSRTTRWCGPSLGPPYCSTATRVRPRPASASAFPSSSRSSSHPEAGKQTYLLITPSGARVELRQTATANIYEAVDSSYLQLTENGDGTLTVRTTDGTQLAYSNLGSVFRCTKIKDRNGNFITINHNAAGNVETVVDTLGRTVTFIYAGGYLESITQTWQRETASGVFVAETKNWARFYYMDKPIQTNFPNLTLVGVPSGQTFHALTSVKLDDNSSFTFNYTTWGQVNKISHYATDDHLLNYVSYNLPADASQPQADCPRFTEQRVWAENWNGDRDGQPVAGEEAVVVYSEFNFGTGTAQATMPDGTRHKELFETSGWKKGLTTRTETFSADDLINPKKWTIMDWTQDDLGVSFLLNPRVQETHVYDSDGKHRRTRVEYTSFGLPENVFEYDADATTVLKRTHISYLAASIANGTAYTNRRIIGLPEETTRYGRVDGQEKLGSKVTVEYDLAGEFLVSAGAPTHHDSAAYGDTFLVRGNACRSMRWDVDDPEAEAKAVKSEGGYNTTGSLIFSRDALNHKTTISYADSNGGGSLAYPTKVTDAANFFSTMEYNYDLGLKTRGVDPKGAARKTLYDARGRAEKVRSEVNGAYTRFIYGPNYVESYATVNNVADEAHSLQVVDGAGRTIATAGNHPVPGSESGFSGRLVHFDVRGLAIQQSNPTETSISILGVIRPYDWQATGDDASVGWVYTKQTYDWKGRPLVTTNPSVTGDPADTTTKEATYEGCGCAGGEVVTLTDEGTPEGGVTKRRRKKIHADILGRTFKTEVFDWEGGPAYSTTVNSYNARDQVTVSSQFKGDTSGVHQETTMAYDGHGRLKTEHVPEQNVGTATTYEYFEDDTTRKITDSRGASQTFVRNSRQLVTSITYAVPAGSSIPATAPVGFGYDAGGNRLWMTDVYGQVDYEYDSLSQLRSESRTYSNTPTVNGIVRTLTYDYTLAGDLKSVKDPYNAQIDYGYDNAGRVNGVTGTPFANNVTTYASEFSYRAFNALRKVKYGNNLTLDVSYNGRLSPSQYDFHNAGGARVMGADYRYYDDGRLKYVDDLMDHRFDRLYAYDSVGSVTKSESGGQARITIDPNTTTPGGPYNHYYGHDEFGNLTSRTGSYWYRGGENYQATYLNNRNQNSGWLYDADGRVTQTVVPGTAQTFTNNYIYDAAGRRVEDATYDGDGLDLRSHVDGGYAIRSTMLGGRVVTEMNVNGGKARTNVYLGTETIAQQEVSFQGGQSITWQGRRDPLNTSITFGTPGDQKALDIQGVATDMNNQAFYNQTYSSAGSYGGMYGPASYGGGGTPGNYGGGCRMDGIERPVRLRLHLA